MATSCEEFVWNSSFVSECALHNLTSWCPKLNITNDTASLGDSLVDALDSPATFFIQLVRLSLSLTLLTVIAALYNCLSVLDRSLLITATCSLYWILYFTLTAVKAVVLMLLIPLALTGKGDEYMYEVNLTGFLATTILQVGLSYTLYLALDHERRFRSPDHAAINGPPDKCCSGLRLSRVVCSKWRVMALVLACLPLGLLIAIEIVFKTNDGRAPAALVWLFVISLLCIRVAIVTTAIQIIFLTQGNSRPTITAKVFLIFGCLLSMFEDLPNSLFAVAIHQPDTAPTAACLLHEMTLYDLFQLVGVLSLIPFTLFIRSQFLRIDQECKLVLLWDMQKLLQVNGRKDVIRHYNT